MNNIPVNIHIEQNKQIQLEKIINSTKNYNASKLNKLQSEFNAVENNYLSCLANKQHLALQLTNLQNNFKKIQDDNNENLLYKADLEKNFEMECKQIEHQINTFENKIESTKKMLQLEENEIAMLNQQLQNLINEKSSLHQLELSIQGLESKLSQQQAQGNDYLFCNLQKERKSKANLKHDCSL